MPETSGSKLGSDARSRSSTGSGTIGSKGGGASTQRAGAGGNAGQVSNSSLGAAKASNTASRNASTSNIGSGRASGDLGIAGVPGGVNRTGGSLASPSNNVGNNRASSDLGVAGVPGGINRTGGALATAAPRGPVSPMGGQGSSFSTPQAATNFNNRVSANTWTGNNASGSFPTMQEQRNNAVARAAAVNALNRPQPVADPRAGFVGNNAIQQRAPATVTAGGQSYTNPAGVPANVANALAQRGFNPDGTRKAQLGYNPLSSFKTPAPAAPAAPVARDPSIAGRLAQANLNYKTPTGPGGMVGSPVYADPDVATARGNQFSGFGFGNPQPGPANVSPLAQVGPGWTAGNPANMSRANMQQTLQDYQQQKQAAQGAINRGAALAAAQPMGAVVPSREVMSPYTTGIVNLGVPQNPPKFNPNPVSTTARIDDMEQQYGQYRSPPGYSAQAPAPAQQVADPRTGYLSPNNVSPAVASPPGSGFLDGSLKDAAQYGYATKYSPKALGDLYKGIGTYNIDDRGVRSLAQQQLLGQTIDASQYGGVVSANLNNRLTPGPVQNMFNDDVAMHWTGGEKPVNEISGNGYAVTVDRNGNINYTRAFNADGSIMGTNHMYGMNRGHVGISSQGVEPNAAQRQAAAALGGNWFNPRADVTTHGYEAGTRIETGDRPRQELGKTRAQQGDRERQNREGAALAAAFAGAQDPGKNWAKVNLSDYGPVTASVLNSNAFAGPGSPAAKQVASNRVPSWEQGDYTGAGVAPAGYQGADGITDADITGEFEATAPSESPSQAPSRSVNPMQDPNDPGDIQYPAMTNVEKAARQLPYAGWALKGARKVGELEWSRMTADERLALMDKWDRQNAAFQRGETTSNRSSNDILSSLYRPSTASLPVSSSAPPAADDPAPDVIPPTVVSPLAREYLGPTDPYSYGFGDEYTYYNYG